MGACTAERTGPKPTAAAPPPSVLQGRVICGIAGTELDAATEQALRENRVAGVMLMGYNVRTREQVRRLVGDIRNARPLGGADPLVAIDVESRSVNRLRWLKLPSVAAMRKDKKLVASTARTVYDELRSLGITVNFAPVADLDSTEGRFLDDRTFGSEPEEVASAVQAWLDATRASGVESFVKHYPGHGMAERDTHKAPVQATPSEKLWQRSQVPFARAARAGVAGFMLNHVTYDGFDDQPASLSPAVVEYLRDWTRGADPVLITDDGTMGALREYGGEPERAAAAFRAGVDLYLTVSPVQRLGGRFLERVAAADGEHGTPKRVERLRAQLQRAVPLD